MTAERRPIDPPDAFHILAAQGWLELGNTAEANNELAKVAPELRKHPTFLAMRWEVSAKSGDWASSVEVGNELIELEPSDPAGWINRAYGLRRTPGGSVQAAYDALRPGINQAEDVEMIAFNLACYACQLGRLEEARLWLRQSFEMAGKQGRLAAAKQLARDEADLKELWGEIDSL